MAEEKERKNAGIATIRIKQVRSGIGCPRKHKLVLRGLGFRRPNQVVERPDDPGTRGMIFIVRHLVEVLEERA